MNSALKRITRATELHRHLVELKNFEFKPHGRDQALYRHIKTTLNLPDGEFLKALEACDVSAGAYMRALMQAAQPFSSMYRQVLRYCEKSETQRSKSGTQLEWSMKIDDEVVPFSLEHLRIYEEIESRAKPDFDRWFSVKNDVMEWLSKCALPDAAYGKTYPYNWDEVELFRILFEARERTAPASAFVFKGLTRVYFGPEHGRPPADVRGQVDEHPKYHAMLALVRLTFGTTSIEKMASDFIDLPLWKFRWQVYELWVLSTVLQYFEPLGFGLQRSLNGNSLLELGIKTTVARHSPTQGSIVYQPTYAIADGREVKPDIVVTLNQDVSSGRVGLIIEAKQRAEMTQAHVDDVADRYSQAVSAPEGRVIIVNYDALGSCQSPIPDKVALLGEVLPGSAAEQEMLRHIALSAVVRQLRHEVWYVDVSVSMASFVDPQLRQQLRQREQFAASCDVFAFASNVVAVEAEDLCASVSLSASPSDSEWEGYGIDMLGKHIAKQRSVTPDARFFVLTDLANESREWGNLGELLGRDVRLLHPQSAELAHVDP
jgi:hypothetical protein